MGATYNARLFQQDHHFHSNQELLFVIYQQKELNGNEVSNHAKVRIKFHIHGLMS